MHVELPKNKTYLLAVSGGIDSMVMCDLFLKHQLSFAVAHCNFSLRGNDSDDDESLVQEWCQKNQITFWTKKFDTEAIAFDQSVSIQVAARQLRYGFFNELLQQQQYNCLVTAHHRDDNIETALFHFFRGTGLQGLQGIPAENGSIIRPMLTYSKEELRAYAVEHQIQFREDRSNQLNDYTRNKLRNVIIPQLSEIFPSFQNNIAGNIHRFSETFLVFQQQIERYRKKLIEPRGRDFYIPLRKLNGIHPLPIILYELLKPFQFSYEQTLQVLRLLNSESGRKLENDHYILIKDRNFLIITLRNMLQTDFILLNDTDSIISLSHFDLQIKRKRAAGHILVKHPDCLQADTHELREPLIFRPWRTGDYMIPLGMKKKKKISRILIDMKIPLHEKERVWVLESDKRIVWLAGIKIDERFKISERTKNILQIELKRK